MTVSAQAAGAISVREEMNAMFWRGCMAISLERRCAAWIAARGVVRFAAGGFRGELAEWTVLCPEMIDAARQMLYGGLYRAGCGVRLALGRLWIRLHRRQGRRWSRRSPRMPGSGLVGGRRAVAAGTLGHVGRVAGELDELRQHVLHARADGDRGMVQALEGAWQLQLQELLRADPALAAELVRVLDQVLTPALGAAGQVRTGKVAMTGVSRDSSTLIQIGIQVSYGQP